MSEFNQKISSRTRKSAPKLIDALSSQNEELKEEVLELKEQLKQEKEKTTKQEIELQRKRGNSLLACQKKSYLICEEFYIKP